jgi:hypothetical protein
MPQLISVGGAAQQRLSSLQVTTLRMATRGMMISQKNLMAPNKSKTVLTASSWQVVGLTF